MGLQDMKCDSCGEEFSFLFPLATIQELPSGGECMTMRFYCYNCYDILMDTAKEESESEDDEDDDEDNEGIFTNDTCGCCLQKVVPDKDEKLKDYFCWGCRNMMCLKCGLALDNVGEHTIEDHRLSCRQKGIHQ